MHGRLEENAKSVVKLFWKDVDVVDARGELGDMMGIMFPMKPVIAGVSCAGPEAIKTNANELAMGTGVGVRILPG